MKASEYENDFEFGLWRLLDFIEIMIESMPDDYSKAGSIEGCFVLVWDSSAASMHYPAHGTQVQYLISHAKTFNFKTIEPECNGVSVQLQPIYYVHFFKEVNYSSN